MNQSRYCFSFHFELTSCESFNIRIEFFTDKQNKIEARHSVTIGRYINKSRSQKAFYIGIFFCFKLILQFVAQKPVCEL